MLGVTARAQERIPRVDNVDGTHRVRTNDVLHDHHFARLRHSKVGLRSNDQREILKRGCGVLFDVRVVDVENFAQILWAAIGSDSPKNIGQKLWTEIPRHLPEVFDRKVDVKSALAAFDFRDALGTGHLIGAPHVNFGFAAMAVIHGFNGARDELGPVGKLRIVIASHSVRLRQRGGGKCGQQSDRKESKSHGFPRNAVSSWRTPVKMLPRLCEISQAASHTLIRVAAETRLRVPPRARGR